MELPPIYLFRTTLWVIEKDYDEKILKSLLVLPSLFLVQYFNTLPRFVLMQKVAKDQGCRSTAFPTVIKHNIFKALFVFLTNLTISKQITLSAPYSALFSSSYIFKSH
jgi:hypothetical protein